MSAATLARPPRLVARQWRAIGVDVRVVVTAPDQLDDACAVVEAEVAALDLACSRFRDDAEVVRLDAGAGRPVPVSPLLVRAVRVALDAAARTGGDLDPTLGTRLAELGYDRDFTAVLAVGTDPTATVRLSVERPASWRDVVLDDDAGTLAVPAGVRLDLGATAKALGADLAADRVARECGCGVLVSLGGDIAVAGPAPEGGWPVQVAEQPAWAAAMDGAGVDDEPLAAAPQTVVALGAGGLATSTTTARRWVRGSDRLHHVLDPVTGLPVRSRWRTVSVASASCVEANIATTTAIVRGGRPLPAGRVDADPALEWLRGLGHPARLVSASGRVVLLNGWPPARG